MSASRNIFKALHTFNAHSLEAKEIIISSITRKVKRNTLGSTIIIHALRTSSEYRSLKHTIITKL